MKCNYKDMMKDGIALKEIGERLISYAREMDGAEDEKDDDSEEKPVKSDGEKASIAIMLKKRMEE